MISRRSLLLAGVALPAVARAQCVTDTPAVDACGGGVRITSPPGVTLDLSFMTTGTLPSGVTFTRASTGTYFDVNGTLQTATTNTPRWDYNPSTHALNGLLIEEARTNSVLNSATLVTQNVTVTAVPWTLSFYGTGTVTLSGVSTAGPLTGTGAANRVALAFTPTAGTLTLTVTGSVTSAQLEAGTFATSYIPTAGAAATRAIEICTMPTAAWFNTAVGSAVTDLLLPQVLTTGSNIEMLALDQGATTDIIVARQSGATNVFATNSFVAGVNKGGPLVAAPPLVAGLVSRAGFTYTVSSAVITVALNGSTVTSSTTTGLPTAISRFTFGTGRNTPLNGYLRRVRYWPRALTNAELQSVTT